MKNVYNKLNYSLIFKIRKLKNITFLLIFSLLFFCKIGLAQQIIVNEEWQTEEGTHNFFQRNRTTVDGSNNVYIVGTTLNGAGNYDILTAKYSSGGQLIWMVSYDGAGGGNDYGTSIAVDANGNVFVTGSAYINSTNNNDLILIKYNSNGGFEWANTYNGSASGDDFRC